MSEKINVTVWNEFRHEKEPGLVQDTYPDGIHMAIADALKTEADLNISTATLDEAEHGLTEEVLAKTDVLLWWGHKAHGDVQEEIVDRVQKHVLEGMGLIVLHSGHFSKIFRRMMGTSCSLKWREIGERERLWNLIPGHPITKGIGQCIELEHTEMYGELFDIPTPDELVFISWFEGGEVFRSGCTWRRGDGKIFYFRPGHETFPLYKNKKIQRVLINACRWAKTTGRYEKVCPQVKEPMEKVGK